LPGQIFSVGRADRSKNSPTPIIELLLLYTLHTIGGQDISCTKWEGVNDFDASSTLDNHYVMDKLQGKIGFGNGVRGRIPDKGDKIMMTYRYAKDSAVLIKPETVFNVTAESEHSNQGLSGTNPL